MPIGMPNTFAAAARLAHMRGGGAGTGGQGGSAPIAFTAGRNVTGAEAAWRHTPLRLYEPDISGSDMPDAGEGFEYRIETLQVAVINTEELILLALQSGYGSPLLTWQVGTNGVTPIFRFPIHVDKHRTGLGLGHNTNVRLAANAQFGGWAMVTGYKVPYIPRTFPLVTRPVPTVAEYTNVGPSWS